MRNRACCGSSALRGRAFASRWLGLRSGAGRRALRGRGEQPGSQHARRPARLRHDARRHGQRRPRLRCRALDRGARRAARVPAQPLSIFEASSTAEKPRAAAGRGPSRRHVEAVAAVPNDLQRHFPGHNDVPATKSLLVVLRPDRAKAARGQRIDRHLECASVMRRADPGHARRGREERGSGGEWSDHKSFASTAR